MSESTGHGTGDHDASDHGTGDVVVRPAQPAEFPAVADLLVRAYTSSFHNSEHYIERLRGIASWVPDYQIWVAVEGQRILGAVLTPSPGFVAAPEVGEDGLVQPVRDDELEFHMIGVDPEARGRGIAALLVNKTIDVARERGIRRIGIHSGPQMTGAHAMYQKLGFVRRPERETLVVDGGQRLLAFTYDIPQSATNPAEQENPMRRENPVESEPHPQR